VEELKQRAEKGWGGIKKKNRKLRANKLCGWGIEDLAWGERQADEKGSGLFQDKSRG